MTDRINNSNYHYYAPEDLVTSVSLTGGSWWQKMVDDAVYFGFMSEEDSLEVENDIYHLVRYNEKQ